MRRLLILASLCAAPLSAQCLTLGPFAATGNLPRTLQPPGTCSEVSGLVASRHDPSLLFVVDDSGNAPQIVALRSDGKLAQQYVLTVQNRDWEDLALGPGPIPGRDYLYVAEIGNNNLTATAFWLHRVPEPDVPNIPGAPITLVPESFRFHYPGTTTHNAETLWIDPVDGTPYVLTKASASTCYAFKYPLPLEANVDKTLQLVATLTNAPIAFTGGAVSPDGRWIHARTQTVIWSWPRSLGASFAAALAGTPCVVSGLLQGQAEAIAVTGDGLALFAISEGAGAPILRCNLALPAAPAAWYAFGSGLGGAAGIPGLGALRAPVLGRGPLALASWQLAPGVPGSLLLSLVALPDGRYPVLGGYLHALPDLALPFTSSDGGTALHALGAPADVPSLRRVALHGQTLLLDPTAPFGVAMSAGLTLALER